MQRIHRRRSTLTLKKVEKLIVEDAQEEISCRNGWSIVYNNFEHSTPTVGHVKSLCNMSAEIAHNGTDTTSRRRQFTKVFGPLWRQL